MRRLVLVLVVLLVAFAAAVPAASALSFDNSTASPTDLVVDNDTVVKLSIQLIGDSSHFDDGGLRVEFTGNRTDSSGRLLPKDDIVSSSGGYANTTWDIDVGGRYSWSAKAFGDNSITADSAQFAFGNTGVIEFKENFSQGLDPINDRKIQIEAWTDDGGIDEYTICSDSRMQFSWIVKSFSPTDSMGNTQININVSGYDTTASDGDWIFRDYSDPTQKGYSAYGIDEWRLDRNDNWVSNPSGSCTWDRGSWTTSDPESNSPPSASFSYSPSPPGVSESVTFDASAASDSDGSIQSYSWDFGDSSSGSGVSPSHSYSSSGTYSVSLTVTDDDSGDGSAGDGSTGDGLTGDGSTGDGSGGVGIFPSGSPFGSQEVVIFVVVILFLLTFPEVVIYE